MRAKSTVLEKGSKPINGWPHFSASVVMDDLDLYWQRSRRSSKSTNIPYHIVIVIAYQHSQCRMNCLQVELNWNVINNVASIFFQHDRTVSSSSALIMFWIIIKTKNPNVLFHLKQQVNLWHFLSLVSSRNLALNFPNNFHQNVPNLQRLLFYKVCICYETPRWLRIDLLMRKFKIWWLGTYLVVRLRCQWTRLRLLKKGKIE